MEVPLPWERLLWSSRTPFAPRARYYLTDFRLVRVSPAGGDELAIADVAEVVRTASWLDRLARTSTLTIEVRNGRRPPFVLPHVRRGAQLAALLELLSNDRRAAWDAESVRAALAWEPRGLTAEYREALVGLAIAVCVIVAFAVGFHGRVSAVAFPPDDAIYPGGVKRDEAAIVRFMEAEVLPWARQALAPIAGGPEAVTCGTCHGLDAEARRWQMPSVEALPQPEVAKGGWEIYSGGMDAQMRNAIYGYVAESDNQSKAAYMREIVMPGMARLLHRPAYDFTRSYDYNRSRLAFGCYHCHKVH